MESNDLGASAVADQALVNQAPTGLGPTGFDPSRAWPLQPCHQRLPKWARLEIADLLCDKINAEMAPDIRGVAKRVLGGNCTFSDDDLSLLACLAVSAIDMGLHFRIKDPAVVQNIETARQARIRDSDGNPKGGDGTAPSHSDDSAARRDRP